ncbi:MAG: hypothetical protein DRP85_06240 [Candidatus Makaraimicrobium thalassicum]|nr:MAG: hypothetical protein DRP85_06240 [Candidatus Omnitrophota bacterium]
MEKETFTSDDAMPRFNELSDSIWKKYGVIVQLAEVRGNRWSYVAGQDTDCIPVSHPERVKLNERAGVIIYYRDGRDQCVRNEITRLLEEFGKNS